MGGCFSLDGDVRGGGGGGGGRTQGGVAASAQLVGPNDAVDYFFQTRGLRGLYTPIEVRKKMNSAAIGLCVASTVVAIAVPLITSADSLSMERDPCTMCFALALCVAFHGAVALIVRGVRRR